MLSADDLELAVAREIVSESQASALRALAEERTKARAIAHGHEERFRFMNGFNDFFLAVGLALAGAGLAFFTVTTPSRSLAAAAMTWALAELLVARMRLVLPGILLVCIFAAFAVLASPIDLWLTNPSLDWGALQAWFTAPRTLPHEPQLKTFSYAFELGGAAAALLFYARFKLPFALLVVAGLLVVAVTTATPLLWPAPTKSVGALVLLGCGLSVFLVAMAFDGSDRERLTRRADCAFWLHLLAAPLIVHSLIALVTPNPFDMSSDVAWTVSAIFAGLTLVAVAIDRRALLVSALIYIGVVIAYGIKQTLGTQTGEEPAVLFGTLLTVGAFVLVIGVGWLPLRRVVTRLLPRLLTNHLPPAVAVA